ncbi:uncharacterized [Tachysurus ichikawai]
MTTQHLCERSLLGQLPSWALAVLAQNSCGVKGKRAFVYKSLQSRRADRVTALADRSLSLKGVLTRHFRLWNLLV